MAVGRLCMKSLFSESYHIVRIHASREGKNDAIEKLISFGANVETKDK